MTIERTLSIIKPDGVGKRHIGDVIARFEKTGLYPVAMKMVHLTRTMAEHFYEIHQNRPFFSDLVSFMISGPVVVMVLEGEAAILKNRDIMGATDPKQAAVGTIRGYFADSIDENIVHGSDSADTARIEIAYFFSGDEICPRTR